MNDTARKILVTGGTGFVGQNLIPALAALGHTVISPSRADLGSIDGNTDWSAYLDDIDTVIHLAGRAHVMKESAANPIDLYRAVNLHGTDNLARQAADASVRRFIFISSVKVMGEASSRPLSAADTPAPVDPYGVSKAEAEEALLKYAGRLELVSLRPPLVYGPGVKGNFIALLKLTARGYPLPLGAIRNRRSMIYVKNLVSAIIHSINCETGTYLPSDGQDLSTPDLFRLAGTAMGRSARLLPVPVILLQTLGFLTGKSSTIQRLTGSLTVDGALPGWSPPVSVERGMTETVDWYHHSRRDN